MKEVDPYATVISSGDNESYSHPRADAIGCAGKYSRSKRPLVFSTELARSTNAKTDAVKYGMINLRCDGDKMIMAQMKEAYANGDVWDLYKVG
jgi:competence protein ComEC